MMEKVVSRWFLNISDIFCLPEWFQRELFTFHANYMKIYNQLGLLFDGRLKTKTNPLKICFRNRGISTQERNPSSQQNIKLMLIKMKLWIPPLSFSALNSNHTLFTQENGLSYYLSTVNHSMSHLPLLTPSQWLPLF